MGEVINLNRVKKQRARAKEAAEAAANRARFGRTRAEKSAEVVELARKAALLDQVRLDEPPKV